MRSADRDAQSADRRRTRGARTEEEEEEEEERRRKNARSAGREKSAERGQKRRRRRRRKEGRAEREEERRDHHCAGEKAVGAASERREARKESSGSHPRREDKPEGQREEPDGRRAADATWRRRSPIQGRRWRRPSKEQHKAVPRAVPKVHGAEASTERTERNDRSGVGTGMPVRMTRKRLERGRPRGLLPRNDTAPDRCRGWSPTAGWTERRA